MTVSKFRAPQAAVSIREALSDPALLGGVLAGPSWQAWRVLLIAAMGEPLTEDERALFTALTGRAREPNRRVEELVAIVGRRGGKSRAMAVLACFLAALCDCRDVLAPGERGVVLCIAPDQRQAKITLEYCTAALEASPIMRQLIANRTSDTLELTDGVTVEVRAASFRRLRGPTYVAVIADEAAFWHTDDSASVNPDSEIIGACRPGLATTGGPLIIASSPYARKGILWTAHRKHYGPDGDPLILVAKGTSRTFNPSLRQSVVDRALEADRAAATAEYLAEFRSDLEAFVPLEVVEACIGDHVEMPPARATQYRAFCDPSGGSADSFALAIQHKVGDTIIIDLVRERRPPFSPEETIGEFAGLLKAYRCTRVTGDRYGGEFPRELFRKHGVTYKPAEQPKSALYTDLLPLLNSGRFVLPRNDRLVAQLVGL